MNLHWKLLSSLTRAGSMLRVVVWAARIDQPGEERRYIYRECVYEVGQGGLLVGEDEEAKRLVQTRYGTSKENCSHDSLEAVLGHATVTLSEVEAPC